jgi:NAD(P)-dependent dehydrogenase (short-subunit alcohol dehydrogenase family)
LPANGRETTEATAPQRAAIIGNSDGIGFALTRRLLASGWTVTGLSRSDSPVTDERYVHRVVDVTASGYPDVLARSVDALGGIDLCVYAAGMGELLDLDRLSEQTRALEVNLIGTARTVEAVVPRMVSAGGGHLVGLSSLADVGIFPEAPGYAASKAGMSTYLLSLGLALRPRNVAVTNVRFGFVDTKMAKAPRKPMMISTEKAVDVLIEALRTRPAVVSYPRSMAVGASLLRAVTVARLPRRIPDRPISKQA